MIDSQRKKLLLEKEERDRKMADKFQEQEQKRKEALKRKKDEAEKADAEMARRIQEELEEERKKETASRRRFMMEASGFEECEDENSFWKTKDPKTGRSYYVNCKTMKTTWELPESGRIVPRKGEKGTVISNSSSNMSASESPRKALLSLERRLLRFYAVYKSDMASQVRDIAQRYVRMISFYFKFISQSNTSRTLSLSLSHTTKKNPLRALRQKKIHFVLLTRVISRLNTGTKPA